MPFGVLFGDQSWLQILVSFGMLMVFFLFFPKLMLMQIVYKIKNALMELEGYSQQAEEIFLNKISQRPSSKLKEELEPMKSMVVSPPTSLDPQGLVSKLEHVLDSSEGKMKDYIDSIAPDKDEEEKANLLMGFKGVYGTYQIFLVIRHFQQLIKKTDNFQLGSMLQMVLPVYKELAEAQKDATKAFINEVPIGDSVGPLLAAKFMENEGKEIAEDIVHSKQEVEGKQLHVLKSKGPGARLGKYGDAVKGLLETEDISKIITVDAGMRFEGEETGKVVVGAGVLMGGPGVEKFKIEEVASNHDVPLDGFVIKQTGPQASKPMHHKIYSSVKKVEAQVKKIINKTDGDVLLIGVGNSVGIGNSKEAVRGVHNKLRKYWKEQEEETTSYFGLMKAFPMGGGSSQFNPQRPTNQGQYHSLHLFRSLLH